MKISQAKYVVPILCTALFVTACGSQQGGQQGARQQSNVQVKSLNDASVIPYYGGTKTQTTNQHGTTTQGMGSGVFSTIGSSGLHTGGISSNLESRLSGAGIDGVRVFVFDDTVFLVKEKNLLATTHYDPLQHKVLTPYGGQSGKGPEPNSSIGTQGSGKESHDNLVRAKDFMTKQLGSGITILTTSNPGAADVVKRMKSNLKSAHYSQKQLLNDFSTLMQMCTKG